MKTEPLQIVLLLLLSCCVVVLLCCCVVVFLGVCVWVLDIVPQNLKNGVLTSVTEFSRSNGEEHHHDRIHHAARQNEGEQATRGLGIHR